ISIHSSCVFMPTSSVGIFNGKVGQFLGAAVGHFHFAANNERLHGVFCCMAEKERVEMPAHIVT
ncbi:hypothetical protein, partial [Desulfobulbus sp.]|uniref:hypothetical protein n=1 Tax=Desulfobulbus sp. TaxID=895 RepID=UPI00286F9F6A